MTIIILFMFASCYYIHKILDFLFKLYTAHPSHVPSPNTKKCKNEQKILGHTQKCNYIHVFHSMYKNIDTIAAFPSSLPLTSLDE